MSAIDLAAALEAVRLGEATQEHAAVLAEALGPHRVKYQIAALRAARDAALEEQRRAVTRLAEVIAERDRLLAVVVAQAEASVRGVSVRLDDLRAWLDAIEATEALGRELRGGAR